MSAFLFILTCAGCSEEKKQTEKTVYNCIDCHTMLLDENHLFSCTRCHKGTQSAADMENAHKLLIFSPSHPSHMIEICGDCHRDKITAIPASLHYTMTNSINMFRRSFGAEKILNTFLATPKTAEPQSILALADDLLRRRCFTCHPFNHGDNYPLTRHGTGCASCHLSFQEEDSQNHIFTAPRDIQCLSCHYGNHVGFDYYGRFEHDLNAEYRTPHTTKGTFFRPYGVEFHQLKPDIHQQKGLWCIDCHSGKELMNTSGQKPSCEGCHLEKKVNSSPLKQIEMRGNNYLFRDKQGNEHPLPLLSHPAHFEYQQKVSCQACHAQWTFNDSGKHYLRSDSDDFDSWSSLTTQANSEVQAIMENNIDFDKTEIPAQMSDKITGEIQTGLWLKGYSQRRWENVLLGRDKDGMITTVRPLLDYFLSWVDKDDNVRFDSVMSQSANNGYLPYVPHTIGSAGIFYRQRIEQFLIDEQSTSRK